MGPEKLARNYITVQLENGRSSYGGDQSWLKTRAEQDFGCGLIAAADILRYLRRKEGRETEKLLTREEYLKDIHELSESFRIRGPLGITGFGIANRMNRLFRREGLPYRSKWSFGRKRLERRIPEMLSADIPVLLSVGPGFFHPKERLKMYRETESGELREAQTMRDHYVTVTERCRTETGEYMLRLSSWGNMYYVNQREYLEHVKKYDNFLFSSILYIRKKENKENDGKRE